MATTTNPSTEIAVPTAQDKMLALPEDDFSALPTAEASDFKIPVLTVIQPTSQLDGTPGDVVDSNTKLKLFGVDEAINFIPLWFYKDFAVYEYTNGQRGKYLRREARGPHNMQFEKFDQRVQKDPDGKDVIYMLRNCFFVLLEKDLDQAIPQIYLLRYKGASITESKNAIMTWDRCVRTKVRPYSVVLSLTPKMEKNEKGKYVVLRTSTVQENNAPKQLVGDKLLTAYNWHKIILENQESMTAKVGSDTEDEKPAQSEFEAGKLNY